MWVVSLVIQARLAAQSQDSECVLDALVPAFPCVALQEQHLGVLPGKVVPKPYIAAEYTLRIPPRGAT